MSVRSKSLHPAWNQTSSFGSKGITGGIKCAACTNTPSPASLQCQHTWEGICYPLFIEVMLLLLLEMPQGFIWDRQHTKLGTEGTAPLIPTNRESPELWAHTLNTAGWLCHLNPSTLITSHRSAAQNCQHFIPYISRSLEWVRFLMRNLGQNDWFPALVWKNHNNVGGWKRLQLCDFTTAQNTFWSVFFLPFLPEPKALSLKAPCGPLRGVHQLKIWNSIYKLYK